MKTITIGRSSQCDIILSDSNISRVHAEISVANGQYVYHDRSNNGSNVGGQIINNRKIVVAPGTAILLANRFPLPWDRVYSLLPASGYRVSEAETQYQQQPHANMYAPPPPAQYQRQYVEANPDRLDVGLGILAFIIPLAGIIMYFAWKNETPKKANTAGMLGIISFIWQFMAIAPYL